MQAFLVALCLFSGYGLVRLNDSLGDQHSSVGQSAWSDIPADFVATKDQSDTNEDSVMAKSLGSLKPGQEGSRNFSTTIGPFSSRPKFYILAPPQVTTSLLQNNSSFPYSFYQKTLNEECAELWLYRGTGRLSYEEGQTHNASEADFFLLPGLLHLYSAMTSKKGVKQDHSFVGAYKKLIVDPTKPHLILVPTWNPTVSRVIGLKTLAKELSAMGVNLWSVGFERNVMWQNVPTNRIVPIPYVVRPSHSEDESITRPRLTNFVFYAGDKRQNAKQWAGCHRDELIEPIQNETDMDVRIVSKGNRLNQTEYNRLMSTSEYCLIVCGDTPSSRSLTSAIVSGCIPIRVGSRLRGLCEPPCKKGYGWKPTGVDNPHLPYPEAIHWDQFPEVDEAQFMKSGKEVLQELFQRYDGDTKSNLRSTMQTTRNAWIYGWGNPVNSEEFGGATTYVLNSFQEAVKSKA
jgi:hypothetical protein